MSNHRSVMSASESKPTTGVGPVYECLRCKKRVDYNELQRYISFRCPYCGYRIFRKTRSPIVKRVKAR